ncbi:MAG TPA: tRNA (N(6)-L-threonylcarbamoyladenosine(37)-C(2))-methylthiotransferase MtaB [Clostridia bacterium]|nr:tRNA (N(6)-L-threonylcarbamoyladenosine(37)-C(2))-methylthiotransferase MtaB [Clostridia bacterium]
MTTVAFITLGCKVNQYDTDVMKTSFLQRGYSFAEASEKADIYVVNTCTVTGTAARKSRQMVARARKLNPDALVVVTGCLGQLESEEVLRMTEADIVTGNVEKSMVVSLVEEYSGSRYSESEDIFKQDEYIQDFNSTQDERTRVFIKVQDGCNNFCSYCAIPFARGMSRSRKGADVLREIENYVEKGASEVVITGIHLDSYGEDLKDYRLIDLLEDIDGIKGLSRVRLGSLEPGSITRYFVRKASVLGTLCHHFHLSLQSGCDETLERMKRRYTTEEFASAVELIREYFPDAAITTDVIVGFPGESDEEFQKTASFVESIGFMKIHVFKFSARKGTLAYGMDGKVSGDVKKHRSEIIAGLSAAGFMNFAKKEIGKHHMVIAEQVSDVLPGYWEGHTGNYMKTLFKCEECEAGGIYEVILEQLGDEFVFSSLHSSTGV